MNNSLNYITGITGFVGENLRSNLGKGFNVIGISRQCNANGIDYPMFLDENLPYNAIIHLAGIAHDNKNTSNEEEYYDTNFELTKALYDKFMQSEGKKFIFLSSVKAAADKVEFCLNEEVNPNPMTVYGKSKLMAENYILANIPKDKQVFILRPCMIHGSGNKGNLNLLYKVVNKNIPWPLGSFENKRSFCSIDNLMFIIKEIILRDDIPSGIYNVADDEPLSTNEVIGLIAQSQNRTSNILNISKWLIERVAILGDKLNLPLNSERLDKLTSSYVVSNVKIKVAIGKPLPVSSREGLLKTFKSFIGK